MANIPDTPENRYVFLVLRRQLASVMQASFEREGMSPSAARDKAKQDVVEMSNDEVMQDLEFWIKNR